MATATAVEAINQEVPLSLDEVKLQVLTYLQKCGNANTSNILFDLGLDPDLVLDALDILKDEGKIGCRDVQTTNEE